MTKISAPDNSRRHFLSLGLRVVSGLAVPLAFSGCDRTEGEEINTALAQTFIQPTVLESKDGLLDIELTVSYFDTELSGLDPPKKYPVSLRAYGYNTKGPDFFGPTLALKGGDQLRIKLINKLPLNPPGAPIDPLLYMKPNTTNLHTHGLHVFPGIYNDSNSREYGDYVVDSNSGGVVPRGDSRQYVYNLPANHPAGPFYYHPQFHGSSALQGASLMQGAIMVRGPVDDLPEMAQATELIFLFQAPYFSTGKTIYDHGVKAGSLEKFDQIANHPTGRGTNRNTKEYLDAQPVLINGVRQPTIVMTSGEVQRWRFINTQIFNCLNLNLDDHVLHQFTVDGWGTSSYQEFADARKNGGKGIVLSAGNRSSVIVKAGKPGSYLLRSLPSKIATGKEDVFLPGDVLARIIVVASKDGSSLATTIPATPLPVSDFLKPIGDEEFANAGGKKRSIVLKMRRRKGSETGSDFQSTMVSSLASREKMASNKEISNQDNLARTDSGGATSATIEDADFLASRTLAGSFELQPSNSVIQYVIEDAVEEWTIFNFDSHCRPFHIHVNPMYVIKVNGVPIEPYWCDTVNLPEGGARETPTSVTFRMRFKDFSGPFIMHSQMLQESDLGLIQRVTVLPAQ